MGSPSPVKEPRERDRERDRERHYSHKAEHRIQKRRSERSRSKKRTLRDLEDDESDSEEPQSKSAAPVAAVKQTYAMSIASFMHWIEAHPNLPSVLSYYLQLGVNLVLAGVFVYIIYCAWSAVLADVDIEASKYMSQVTVEISACAKQYIDNRCDPEQRVPAMEKPCNDWERCMNRDAHKVARASVTAKTFAMIFNSFVEEFSYKSMVCLVFFLALWVWMNKTLHPRPPPFLFHACARRHSVEIKVMNMPLLPLHITNTNIPSPRTRPNNSLPTQPLEDEYNSDRMIS